MMILNINGSEKDKSYLDFVAIKANPYYIMDLQWPLFALGPPGCALETLKSVG